MKKTSHILEMFPEYLFWDVKIDKLDLLRDKDFIIPRVLFMTTSDTFEKDIQRLEQFYTKREILHALKNTKEPIPNIACELTAKRYNIKPFYRFDTNKLK